MKKGGTRLTINMQRFADEYIRNGGRSGDAYVVAYKPQKCSATECSARGWKLLQHPRVADYIARLRRSMGVDACIDAVKVLEEAYAIALCDPREIIKEDGTIKPAHEWPAGVAKAVAAVKVIETGLGNARKVSTEIRFWDKNAALDKLFKNCGLYAKDKLVNVNVDHQHHHVHESVRDTESWLEGMFGDGEERPTKVPLPN